MKVLGFAAVISAMLVTGAAQAMLMETEKVELPTGRLEANIRHTRASYSRPRRVVEEMMRARPKVRQRPWKGERW
jgi:hypothetical protein